MTSGKRSSEYRNSSKKWMRASLYWWSSASHVAQSRDSLWVSTLKLASIEPRMVPFTIGTVAANTYRTTLEYHSFNINKDYKISSLTGGNSDIVSRMGNG